jgi:hypothetical protein
MEWLLIRVGEECFTGLPQDAKIASRVGPLQCKSSLLATKIICTEYRYRIGPGQLDLPMG